MNPFDSGYYNEHELNNFGFKAVGHNVRIEKKCTIIGLENITIGNNVKIDGYCTIVAARDGWLHLGSFIHIGAYSFLSAGAGIFMDDFSGLSQGVRIYSVTDDYSGNHLTNPTIPNAFTGITSGTVEICRHVIVGSSSVILPKVKIGEGVSIGALTLVTKNLEPWGIYAGCPAKRLKERSKKILDLEQCLMQGTKSTTTSIK